MQSGKLVITERPARARKDAAASLEWLAASSRR